MSRTNGISETSGIASHRKPPPSRLSWLTTIVWWLLTVTPVQAEGLVELTDDNLAVVTGAGAAISLSDFSFGLSNTGFVEAIGSGSITTGNRADLYWLNPTISNRDGDLNSRDGGGIPAWGSAQDPWVLRVESPTGYKYDGTSSTWPVLTYIAPKTVGTNYFKYAFWGDLQVKNQNSNNALISRLQSQAVWDGLSLNGSTISLFQNTYDGSLGLVWHNRISMPSSSALRFSVAQSSHPAGADADPVTAAPTFDANEGIYLYGLNIDMPIGALHYQPLIVDNDPSSPRNFLIELVRLPNQANVYTDFYDGDHHGSLTVSSLKSNTSAGSVATNGVDYGAITISDVLIQHLSIKTLGL